MPREEGRKRIPEACRKEERKLAVKRMGETRVPIPNTRVKTCAADGTMPGTAWESRRLPVHKTKKARKGPGGLAQLGEHLPCKQGVESSNLLVSTGLMEGKAVSPPDEEVRRTERSQRTKRFVESTLKTEYRNESES